MFLGYDETDAEVMSLLLMPLLVLVAVVVVVITRNFEQG